MESLDISIIKEADQTMMSECLSTSLLDEFEGKSSPKIKIKIDNDVVTHLSNVIIEELSHNSYEQPTIVDNKYNEYVDELIKLFKLMIEYEAKVTNVNILKALTGDDIPKEGQNNINLYFLSFKSFYRIDLIKGFFSLGIDINFDLLLSRRSGDVEILRIRPKLYYNNRSSKKISKGITLNRIANINLNSFNFSLKLFNNVLGKEGNRKCACENCIYCDKLSSENKKLCELYKPFEDIRLHINELNEYDSNKIDMTLAFTRKKKNKVDKLNQFCCSFCNDESATTLRKVFFHNQIDNDHNCYFYFCEYCFENRENEDIVCPNCEQFIVNFYKLNYIRPSYFYPY